MTSRNDATLKQFEQAIAETDDAKYELTLFVSGASGLSSRMSGSSWNFDGDLLG